MVSIREFSRISGLGEWSVRKYVKIDSFPSIKLGRKTLIHCQQACAWLDRLVENHGSLEALAAEYKQAAGAK